MFKEVSELAEGLDEDSKRALSLEHAVFAIPIANQFPVNISEQYGNTNQSRDVYDSYQHLRRELNNSGNSTTDNLYKNGLRYLIEVKRWASTRTIFRCGSDYLGLGPWITREGDIV